MWKAVSLKISSSKQTLQSSDIPLLTRKFSMVSWVSVISFFPFCYSLVTGCCKGNLARTNGHWHLITRSISIIQRRVGIFETHPHPRTVFLEVFFTEHANSRKFKLQRRQPRISWQTVWSHDQLQKGCTNKNWWTVAMSHSAKRPYEISVELHFSY